MKQSIGIESVINARELGGYINTDGKRIKNGLLFRTGKLNTMSEEDNKKLINEYNLKKVFDFRGEGERFHEPDPKINNVENLWIPILEEIKNESNEAVMREIGTDMFKMFMFFFKQGFMKNIYIDIFDNEYGQKQYHKFLKEVIATEEGSIIWHCSAGKDRTGCAALYLLTILGCDEKTILDDYVLTNTYVKDRIEERIDEFRTKGCPEEYMEDVYCIDGVRLEYFESGIEYLKSKYGTVMDYIHNQLNITEEECEILRKRYLE